MSPECLHWRAEGSSFQRRGPGEGVYHAQLLMLQKRRVPVKPPVLLRITGGLTGTPFESLIENFANEAPAPFNSISVLPVLKAF